MSFPEWYLGGMWHLFLDGFILALLLLLLFVWLKTRLDVRALHWRLDGIWRKVSKWHGKVDRVSGEVRRVTGEHAFVDEVRETEEYDDVDRDADTQPRSQAPRKKARKEKKVWK